VFDKPQTQFRKLHSPLRQACFESLDSLRLLGRRSLLALLGIVIGCAAVVALLNIGHNAANNAISAFKSMGANTLVVTFPPQPGSSRPAPADLNVTTLVRAVPSIVHFAPLILSSARIRHFSRTSDAAIIGTSAELMPVLDLKLEQGRFLSNFDRQTTYAIVGARVAQELAIQLGDRLPIEGYLFEVIGIMTSAAFNPLVSVAPDESVFVPIEGMRRLHPMPEIGSIIAQSRDVEHLPEDAAQMKAWLHTIVKNRDVDVQIPQQLLDGLTRQSNTFAWLLAGLGGISLLVGGVGVMNVMLMNVSERRREIGIRMALGARARDIRNLFLFEATTLSVAGALVGAIMGLCAAWGFVQFSGWDFSLSPLSLPLGMLSSLAVGLFFGLHPALSAARLQPIQALRDD